MTLDRETPRRWSLPRAAAWRSVWTSVFLTGLLSSVAPRRATRTAGFEWRAPSRRGHAGHSEIMPVPGGASGPTDSEDSHLRSELRGKAQTELRVGIVFVSGNPASLRPRTTSWKCFGASATRWSKAAIKHGAVEYVSDSQTRKRRSINQHLRRAWECQESRDAASDQRVAADHHDHGRARPWQGDRRGRRRRTGQAPHPHHLASSKAEGSEFDASLLRIAKVVR